MEITSTINKKLMSKFSEWLKTKRKESGMTLMQLKSAIGDLCTDAYLSKLENDRYKGKKGQPNRPDKEIVLALADVFREDANYVLRLANYASKELPILPDELQEFDFSKFSKETLREIADFIRFKTLHQATPVGNVAKIENSHSAYVDDWGKVNQGANVEIFGKLPRSAELKRKSRIRGQEQWELKIG